MAEITEKAKKMFENEERSALKDILPAKHRIKDYKTKNLQRLYTASLNSHRPISGATTDGNADLPTQVHSLVDAEERSVT